MQPAVTFIAERDQILLGILTRAAAELFVVDFQIRHDAA
jgi:hypothetical protein